MIVDSSVYGIRILLPRLCLLLLLQLLVLGIWVKFSIMFVTVWIPHQMPNNFREVKFISITIRANVCILKIYPWDFKLFAHTHTHARAVWYVSNKHSLKLIRTHPRQHIIEFSYIKRRFNAVLFAKCENRDIISEKGRGNGARMCARVCVCEKVSSDHLNDVKFLKGWEWGRGVWAWMTNIALFVHFLFISQ